jgi:hypothetical protein
MLTYAEALRVMRSGGRAAGPAAALMGIRQHTSAYVSIRQHTAPLQLQAPLQLRCQYLYFLYYSAYVSIRQHTSAYVSMRQHTSAYVSIRQHTSAYVALRLPRLLMASAWHAAPHLSVCVLL